MIYTDSAKYALRAVTHIAGHDDPQAPVSATEIAEAEGIPPYYMAKVLQDLARAKVLKSVRGRGGGFRLAQPANKTHVLDVIAAVEDIGRITEECVLGLDECNDTVSCPMHDTWKRFRESLLKRLGRMTVADLAKEMKRKRRGLAAAL